MSLRASVSARVARQLRHPAGLAGHLVAVMMNRRNRRSIAAAVDALSPSPGTVVADIGFGGGLGIELLLDRVGAAGKVHGIEVSTSMLNRAARRFGREIADGRLSLQPASLTDLPLPEASLDGAITINTIYFIADLELALSELARALKPSCHTVIGLADPEWMSQLPTSDYGFRLRPVSEVKAAAAQAGLVVDEHRRVPEGAHPYHLLVVRPASSVC